MPLTWWAKALGMAMVMTAVRSKAEGNCTLVTFAWHTTSPALLMALTRSPV